MRRSREVDDDVARADLSRQPPFTPIWLRIIASGFVLGYGSLSIVGGISVPPVTIVAVPLVTMMYSSVRV